MRWWYICVVQHAMIDVNHHRGHHCWDPLTFHVEQIGALLPAGSQLQAAASDSVLIGASLLL
jgi:hypothetical protein